MDKGYRAVRQLETMLPGIARQNHLRTTNPQRYGEYMRQQTPLKLEKIPNS